jgi:hypothetical protein
MASTHSGTVSDQGTRLESPVLEDLEKLHHVDMFIGRHHGARDGQPGGDIVAMICRTPMGMDSMPGMSAGGSSIITAELKSMIIPDVQARSHRHATAKSKD